MNGKDISSREDISKLVRTFYGKVRKDDLLGPIFNGTIKDWEHHFVRLTDFWENNLFFEKKYHGNPLQKHVEVDRAHGETIGAMHFGVWLNIWYETIDELFEGDSASLAKNRARNMGTFIHLNMFKAREKSSEK